VVGVHLGAEVLVLGELEVGFGEGLHGFLDEALGLDQEVAAFCARLAVFDHVKAC